MKKLNQNAKALAAKITGAISIFMLFMLFCTNAFAQLPYARLEGENLATHGGSYTDYDLPPPYEAYYQYTTVDLHLRLYEDWDCTIPYTVPENSTIQIQVRERAYLGGHWYMGEYYTANPDNTLIWPSSINSGETEYSYTYYSNPDHIMVYATDPYYDPNDWGYLYDLLDDPNTTAPKYLVAPSIGINW